MGKYMRQCINDAKMFCSEVHSDDEIDDMMAKLKQELPNEFYACSIKNNWYQPLHYKVKCFMYDNVDKKIKVVVEEISKNKPADILGQTHVVSIELFEKYYWCKTYIQAKKVYESLLRGVSKIL
jgi:hypothetical protein